MYILVRRLDFPFYTGPISLCIRTRLLQKFQHPPPILGNTILHVYFVRSSDTGERGDDFPTMDHLLGGGGEEDRRDECSDAELLVRDDPAWG